MAGEFTQDEVERLAGELARRVMSQPPQPRTKPKSAAKADADAKPKKRRQGGLGVFGLVSLSPHQTLALAVLQRDAGTFDIVNAQRGAVAVAETGFVQIPLEMGSLNSADRR